MSDRKYWIREMSWVEFDERRNLRSSLTNGK